MAPARGPVVGSSYRKVLTLSVAAAVLFTLSRAPSGATEASGLAASVDRTEAVHNAIRDRLSRKFPSSASIGREQRALIDYYSVPQVPLLWIDNEGLSQRAKSVIDEIGTADDYGLRSADYDLPKPNEFDPNTPGRTNWLADAEIKISFAVLRYTRDARGGRLDPATLSKNLDPALVLPEPHHVIESIAVNSDPANYLRSFQPNHPQFEALRQKLIELRREQPYSPKPVIKIPEGPVLKLGVEHEQVVLLRERLDVRATNGDRERLFDETLLEAVKEFQSAHDTVVDGVVGPGTRRLLNQHDQRAASRAKATLILLNMERWRWLPNLGSFYVMVNVPEFLLRVMAEGDPMFTSRVVVGAANTQTPIFSNEMQEVVFNPYWNVPNSIKTEELLPYMRGGGNSFLGGRRWSTVVLRRNNLRVNIGGREVDPARLDWDRVDIRSLNIYQPPGPDNVLGKFKFAFPNKHDVYLHDTPLKFLFTNPVRAESHGCVRVQDPDQLARLLLERDQGWTAAEIASAIQKGYDQHVALKQKIPIHITYFTLWVNADGSIAIFRDLYGHDARMAMALLGESMASAVRLQPAESRTGRTPDRNRSQRSRDRSNGIAESLSGFMSNF